MITIDPRLLEEVGDLLTYTQDNIQPTFGAPGVTIGNYG